MCSIHLSGPNGTHFIPGPSKSSVFGLYCFGPLYCTDLGPQFTFKDNDEKLVTQNPFVFTVGMQSLTVPFGKIQKRNFSLTKLGKTGLLLSY